MRRTYSFTYADWLLLAFISGILGGTAAALLFGSSVVQGEILGGNAGITRGNPGMEAFFLVLRSRALGMLAGWVAGLTVCSQLLFGVLTFHGAMSLAVVLTVFTVRKGILGIAAFLCAFLPQGILYLFVWFVLARWAGQKEKRIHLPGGIFLLAVTGLGAFLEVFAGQYLRGIL